MAALAGFLRAVVAAVASVVLVWALLAGPVKFL
jgi:hypothetical protein